MLKNIRKNISFKYPRDVMIAVLTVTEADVDIHIHLKTKLYTHIYTNFKARANKPVWLPLVGQQCLLPVIK